jgi:hypothetical protein
MSKLIAVLTTKEIKERIEINKRSATDKKTNKVYFCPRDLGFDFTIEDCKVSYCSECWQEVKDYLEFRSKSEEEH